MGKCVGFEGLGNIRDLGGMTGAGGRAVKAGLLYRSEQLFFATEDDLRLLGDMNIGAVFDFRSFPEREEKPDPEIVGARNLHLPIIRDVRKGITRSGADDQNLTASLAMDQASIEMVDRHMQSMYREFVTEPFANEQYARFVDEVIAQAESGRASLWHCTAGKDRAGFATVVVLEALGVDRAAISADYLLTNAFLADTVDALAAQFGGRLPSDEARAALRRFFQADASYLNAAYRAMEDGYGSAEAFLERALGVDGPKRERMRSLFLEG